MAAVRFMPAVAALTFFWALRAPMKTRIGATKSTYGIMNRIPPTLRRVSSYLSPALHSPRINPIMPINAAIAPNTKRKLADIIAPKAAEEIVVVVPVVVAIEPASPMTIIKSAMKAITKIPRPAKSTSTIVLGVENPRSTVESVLNEDLTNIIETKPNANPTIATISDTATSDPTAEAGFAGDIANIEVNPNPRAKGTIRASAIPAIPRRANIFIFPIATESALVKLGARGLGGGPPQLGGP